MNESNMTPSSADFDAIYRGAPPVAGSDFQFDRAPWDLGEPQPVLVELETAGGFGGRIVDVGCGAGDNTIFLAERGYDVTGVDNSAEGLKQARERARNHGVDVDFFVDDATELNSLQQRFDMVLDSALYHCLPPEQRRDYAAALHRVTEPGAVLRLVCFSDVHSRQGPMAVAERDLRRNLGDYWNITALEHTTYTSSMTRPALVELMRSPEGANFAAQLGIDPAEANTDEQGRITMPMWNLRAQRR